MSLKVLAWATVVVLGFSSAPGLAAGKVSDDDILKICNRVADVCVAACKRKDNFTGQLSEGLCVDDCLRTHTECTGPITQEHKNGIEGTTGAPSDTLEQGQKQKKKKRKKAPTQP